MASGRSMSLCLTLLVVAVAAESPGTISSFGGGQPYSTPATQNVRYAGPIVYTNEKPPVIHFPRPPPPGKGMFGGGSGVFGKGHSIKYVPIPHHDLPILIYQSDISPPIHVVHPTQQGQTPTAPSKTVKSEYNPTSFKSDYLSTQQNSYSSSSPQNLEYDPISADFSSPQKSTFRPSQRPKQQSYSSPPRNIYSSGNYEYASPSKNQYRVAKPYGPPPTRDMYISASSSQPQYVPSKINYEQPKKSVSPLPHIIYAGHPPIHVFQQPPIYMAAPNKDLKNTYHTYTLGKSAYHGPTKSEYMYTSESAPTRTVYGAPKPTFGPSSKPRTEYQTSSKPRTEYQTSSKYRTEYQPSSKPRTEYRTSSRPRTEYRTSSTSEYRPFSPSKKPKTEYGRQQGAYSANAPVYVKPQNTEYVYGPIKTTVTQSYRSPKNWEAPQLTGSYSSPIKYKTTKQVTYSPAPKSWNKPPIIIYQGVKPPVHMFEHVVSFDSVHNPGGKIPSNFATRRISSSDGVDQSGNVQILNNGGYSAPTFPMWIPAYGVQSPNGYPTALYVSDLTSAGSTQQSLATPEPPTASPVTPASTELPVVEGTTPEGSQTTSQVTITTTQADEVKGMTVTESSLSANTPDQTSSADVRIDSILPHNFLATDANDQNSALNSIPMSYTSVMVQAAGSQSSESPDLVHFLRYKPRTS